MSKRQTDEEPTPLDLERAVDIHEVSELLGLAEITIRQQHARGVGPRAFRIGRAIRWRLADVLAFRDARMVGKRVAP